MPAKTADARTTQAAERARKILVALRLAPEPLRAIIEALNEEAPRCRESIVADLPASCHCGCATWRDHGDMLDAVASELRTSTTT